MKIIDRLYALFDQKNPREIVKLISALKCPHGRISYERTDDLLTFRIGEGVGMVAGPWFFGRVLCVYAPKPAKDWLAGEFSDWLETEIARPAEDYI